MTIEERLTAVEKRLEPVEKTLVHGAAVAIGEVKSIWHADARATALVYGVGVLTGALLVLFASIAH